MSKVFCQNKLTKFIAIATTLSVVASVSLFSQLLILVGAGILGLIAKQQVQPHDSRTADTLSGKKGLNYFALSFFLLLFIALPFLSHLAAEISLFNSFYQAGSLVFGGGHVVLPMLQQTITAPLANDTFILGYASAQAVPGPMFTIATFLGANIFNESPVLGAVIATVAIFLPGFLLILAFQNVWQQFAFEPKVSGFVMGVNAAVVGLLSAAFYQPIAMNAIYSWLDIVWVTLGFILLKFYRLPILVLVACFVALGIFMTL